MYSKHNTRHDTKTLVTQNIIYIILYSLSMATALSFNTFMVDLLRDMYPENLVMAHAIYVAILMIITLAVAVFFGENINSR